MRKVTEINVHCAATKPGWWAGKTSVERVAEIRRWHVQDNGWRDIGYHFVIDRDGSVHTGRKLSETGAFEPKVNAFAVGVCLIGGYGSAATDEFSKHYTPDQDEALRKLIGKLQEQFPSVTKVTGHNDYASKACPGFNVSRWLAGKTGPRSLIASKTAQGSAAAALAGGTLGATELVKVASDVTREVRTSVDEVKTARTEATAAAADVADPLRWVLIAVIVIGAVLALLRRWIDWHKGRQ